MLKVRSAMGDMSCDAPVLAALHSLSLPPCPRLLGFCSSDRPSVGAEAEAPRDRARSPSCFICFVLFFSGHHWNSFGTFQVSPCSGSRRPAPAVPMN